MKSNELQLAKRGYVATGDEVAYQFLSVEELMICLRSKTATDRTIAARVLSGQKEERDVINILIEALKVETKLYSKLEICNTLATIGTGSIKPLIAQLGKIGNNQHKTVPKNNFKKKSYPLPRDIAARTLIRIGIPALPALLETLQTDDLLQLSEAIDAIGYICFYNPIENTLHLLQKCLDKHQENELIYWKLNQAMAYS